MISLIACIGKNRELGANGKLLFNLKSDMHFFRDTTMNHKIIMGHKTWNSLPHKLVGRENIVISRFDFTGPDLIIHNAKQLIDAYKDSKEEVFVIGGGMVYFEFLPHAKYLYLTEVNADIDNADTLFPPFDKSDYTQELIRKGKEDGLTYSIIKYTKK